MKAALHFLLALPDWNSAFLGPESPMFEYEQSGNPMQTELVARPVEVRDGFIALDSEPGLGVTINTRVLERYKIQ